MAKLCLGRDLDQRRAAQQLLWRQHRQDLRDRDGQRLRQLGDTRPTACGQQHHHQPLLQLAGLPQGHQPIEAGRLL